MAAETFNVLQKSFQEISEKDNSKLSSLSESFNNARNELVELVNEKEKAIEQLQQKNERLNREVSIQHYSSDIFTILVLGTNQNLTDTIILVVVNSSKQTITLISIPRDLYVNGRKINSIYAAYGIEKIKQDLTRISGLQIDKYIIFDFDG